MGRAWEHLPELSPKRCLVYVERVATLLLFLAFELFAAVEGVPLFGFGLAGGVGGEGGNDARKTREYHVIYSVFLLIRF